MLKVAWMVSLSVLFFGELAAAQPADVQSEAATLPGATGDRPWARGVTGAQRKKAQRLLARGNALFLDSEYRQALAAYRQALEVWDHPALRFNIARTLINLDRPVEAYENIRLAVRHGPAPLPELYAEAKNYQILLRGQLAEITISCRQAGVRVTVDGTQYLDCPGERTAPLLPGQHKVIAEKAGFLPYSRNVTLVPAAVERLEITLLTLEEAAVTRRRWAWWKPRAVVGGSAAVASLGILFEWQAGSARDSYARDLRLFCSDTSCDVDDDLPDSAHRAWRRAQIEHAVGVSAIAIGSAGVLSGLLLVFLNRSRTFLPDRSEQPGPRGVRVVPAVSSDSVGAFLIHRF